MKQYYNVFNLSYGKACQVRIYLNRNCSLLLALPFYYLFLFVTPVNNLYTGEDGVPAYLKKVSPFFKMKKKKRK